MLEQVQTKDKKPIWKKLQYKGSLLVEYAIILGLAAIFLVFNGLFDPIGDKAKENAKAVNKDAYVYGGVPKGSVTQTPDGTTAPTHSSGGQIITGKPSLPEKPNVPVNPGDNIQTNIQFTYDDSGKIWSTTVLDKTPAPNGKIKYFSFNTVLSFGNDCIGKKFKIFFNTDKDALTTKTDSKGNVYLPVVKTEQNGKKNVKDFGSLEIQVITYKYDDQNSLIIDVDGYFRIRDVELSIDKPCYVAFNFRGDNSVIPGMKGDGREPSFIYDYMKIVEIIKN